MVGAVKTLKRARRMGKCYDIICYDSKEETENEENPSPLHPLSKEEKDKEESFHHHPHLKKDARILFERPTLEEVKNYHEELKITCFTAERFYNYYEAYGWKSKGGGEISDWKLLMRNWEKNNEKQKSNRNNSLSVQDAQARHQELVEWMDKNLPMCEGDMAEDYRKALEEYKQRYTIGQLHLFTKNRVIRTMQAAEHGVYGAAGYTSGTGTAGTSGTDTSGTSGMGTAGTSGMGTAGYPLSVQQWWQRIGTMPIIRNVIVLLDLIATDVNTSPTPMPPHKLYSLAEALLMRYGGLTMDELLLAFNNIRNGDHGDFNGRVTKPRFMTAMKKFVGWWKGTLPPPSL